MAMAEILTKAETEEIIFETIGGGMGVAVSNWELAGEIAGTGEDVAGTVSGVLIGIVLARRLQDGDPGGHMHEALEAFPDKAIAAKIIKDYFVPEGREPTKPYKITPMLDARQLRPAVELNMVGAFAEVWLAKKRANEIAEKIGVQPGPIGMNLLTKLQTDTLSALYGAMLAGVDRIYMGAGIPSDIPEALVNLKEGKRAVTQFDITGSKQRDIIAFDPADYLVLLKFPRKKPLFYAIVASNTLAKRLSQNQFPPDGLIVEGPTAGGHNAPPRKKGGESPGQIIYGPRDEVDLEEIAALGLPYILAGSCGTPEGLKKAAELKARGIQAGSAFALCEESGFAPEIKEQYIQAILDGRVIIHTSGEVSTTGFPFKVGVIDEEMPRLNTKRVCDVGALREPYLIEGTDKIGYRCSAEPVDKYVSKGGKQEATMGRVCLCNALLAAVGLGQVRDGGKYHEEAVVTLGDKTPETVKQLVGRYGLHFTAAQVVEYLRG
jgi:NAD(P)H-dependent flavin oxidoreductase YrpB (nitropropane dioxygenase family)